MDTMDRSALRASRSLPVAVFVVAAALMAAPPAQARSAGIDSSQFSATGGCNDCHSGGAFPLVALSASATNLAPGQQITLTVTVTSTAASQIAAGFNLRSSQQGAFAVGGPDAGSTRTIANRNTGWLEATHSATKSGSGAVTTFTSLWTPEAGATGTVTFTAWGNSVNADGRRTGDRASMATLDVTICTPATCPPDPTPDAGAPPDAAPPEPDAGAPDASPTDPDAGATDTAPTDADAGAGDTAPTEPDAGPVPAGPLAAMQRRWLRVVGKFSAPRR
jgi:hypothetical protein